MPVEQPASVHSRSSAGLALPRTPCGDILSHAVPQLPYTSTGASAPIEIFGLGISAWPKISYKAGASPLSSGFLSSRSLYPFSPHIPPADHCGSK